mmetsp:Transcript_34721/g.87293  ORF Transcript_34721/g.87293 Transcript_34721/m.87293 type:complete len:348 (-) Transcript_34721:222-1265(-)|eukprot:CAMPEP_0177653354 /NCGR_PEP_ID=MMETSP0447-20121125/13690_1 /TAXON_ID=0 /ORGANISM="Stygamoeba regulata, Strain BSH-02190019" /LENGTH=347 /DNA_ID=CAMNT_0019156803 /DNA_START=44 /DNA_END=1087 /DNA_ORIENTATION=+
MDFPQHRLEQVWLKELDLDRVQRHVYRGVLCQALPGVHRGRGSVRDQLRGCCFHPWLLGPEVEQLCIKQYWAQTRTSVASSSAPVPHNSDHSSRDQDTHLDQLRELLGCSAKFAWMHQCLTEWHTNNNNSNSDPVRVLVLAGSPDARQLVQTYAELCELPHLLLDEYERRPAERRSPDDMRLMAEYSSPDPRQEQHRSPAAEECAPSTEGTPAAVSTLLRGGTLLFWDREKEAKEATCPSELALPHFNNGVRMLIGSSSARTERQLPGVHLVLVLQLCDREETLARTLQAFHLATPRILMPYMRGTLESALLEAKFKRTLASDRQHRVSTSSGALTKSAAKSISKGI